MFKLHPIASVAGVALALATPAWGGSSSQDRPATSRFPASYALERALEAEGDSDPASSTFTSPYALERALQAKSGSHPATSSFTSSYALERALQIAMAKASHERPVDPDLGRAIRYGQLNPAIMTEMLARGESPLDPDLARAYRYAAERAALGTLASHEPQSIASVRSAFDWADAGVGSAITLGLLALALSGIVVRRKKRGQLTGA